MNDPQKTIIDSSENAGRPEAVANMPSHIGRYRIERVLGQGGFGLVYLAIDDQLSRPVAIKVPHNSLFALPEDAASYLAEARTVANLDHPNIVPVFDVGNNDQFPCFIVSKYIDGTDLASRIKEARPGLYESVEIVATVCEALHYAHKQGLVHRDIKPGNILLDKSGKPFVTDFGLALREQDLGKGPRNVGTPAYMSPEQAQGEGHRVDARSDIFSLAVVFYQLLVGRKPFRADSLLELLEQITSYDPRPPRQYDDNIPKELDRICLKALSKRASERYSTAKDMADDLRHYQGERTIVERFGSLETGNAAPAFSSGTQPISTGFGSGASVTVTTTTSDRQLIKVVPKGLRSFDAHDSDFFIELLPGPRDREGLPDSIRFWKTRIEETDSDNTFSVGLIYGPSGCGKSSLVKAGLLPKLSDNIIPVYVEATAQETETRLLNGLRKRCPMVPSDLSLKDTISSIRRGQFLPPDHKVVLVLDQFEQWLHAKKEETNTDLVQALRQCDGGRVQCIVMVRDDFWLSVSRFLRELEVRLIEGQNSALVDLFDIDHARTVLAAFGRAFGKLPEKHAEMSTDQRSFLELSASGLAQEGKVICVRLALFAEMMKGRSWTPASLKAAGGTAGVGATFLEETFSAATAPPEHRYHQKAARSLLKVLLPESGGDIKGHMKSYSDLLAPSGYENRLADFDDLIRMLDSELRLITPTDPEGKDDDSRSQPERGGKYYQLTHDYLVHSLQEWLTRKQKETARGRAELLLADRASIWSARPENQQLPSLYEWFQINSLTLKNNWSSSQRTMMAKANKYHFTRIVVFAAVLLVIAVGGWEGYGRLEGRRLRDRLLESTTADVPGIVKELPRYHRWTKPLLDAALLQAAQENDVKKQLHASLGLLPYDSNQVAYLLQRLLDSDPQDAVVIRDALEPHKSDVVDRLWSVMESPQSGMESQRLRAAAALAKYDAQNEKWAEVSQSIVDELLGENPVLWGRWTDLFRPAKNWLIGRLSEVFRDSRADKSAERLFATNILADYASDNPQVLADLLIDSDAKQFGVICPKLSEQGEAGSSILTAELERTAKPESAIPIEWTVQLHTWEYKNQTNPVFDWETVLSTPVKDQLQMSHLVIRGSTNSPPPPTDMLRNHNFAAIATSDVTLNEEDYLLRVIGDDAVRLWLDDELLLENWWDNFKMGEKTIPIRGKQGQHRLKIEFVQKEGAYALEADLFCLNDAQERLAKRQANAAIALLRMNQQASVWPILKLSSDPRVRTYLIHRFGPLGVPARLLTDRLETEQDVTIRRALLLSLGEYNEGDLSPAERAALVPKLQAIYRDDPDPGLHAAAEWLLRKWNHEKWISTFNEQIAIGAAEASGCWAEGRVGSRSSNPQFTPPSSSRWYVNSQGQTMIVVPGPVEFMMGSPLTQAGAGNGEIQHRRRIGRTFAVAAKTVTFEQLWKFNRAYNASPEFTRMPNLPAVAINCFMAGLYCNWLSKEDGFPEDQWCFATDEKGVVKGLKPNYLSLTGYRFPTEAEMEYSIRAGTTTSRYYGATEELLGKYAWCAKNSDERTWPVGRLKPNDLGLFDSLGNVYSWCLDTYYWKYQPTELIFEDTESPLPFEQDKFRIIRGLSYKSLSSSVRSASRNAAAPLNRGGDFGIRLARTLSVTPPAEGR